MQLYNELEQRVQERTSQLEAANRELEIFASRVSHDLKSPLRGVSLASDALLSDAGTDRSQLRSCLEAVSTEAKRMIELTDSLLKLSKLSLTELDRKPIDASQLAKENLERLSAAQPLRKWDFRIQPHLELFGDGILLSALLENLLSNAWKYTGHQAQTVIEVRTAEEDDHSITFFVKDNGAGFNQARANKLFEAFQRLHSASEFPGNGVGLATVKRIVIKHHGSIWAESKPGEGATFYCRLPKGKI